MYPAGTKKITVQIAYEYDPVTKVIKVTSAYPVTKWGQFMRTPMNLNIHAVVMALLTPQLLDSRMPDPPAPPTWYTIYVCAHSGAPRTVPLPAYLCGDAMAQAVVPSPFELTPAQDRAIGVIQLFRDEGHIRQMELAIERYQAGQFPEGTFEEGWNNGGGAGIDVDRRGVVSVGNQYDGLEKVYPGADFTMTLAEFLPFWRDWVASQRQFNALLKRHGAGDDGKELPRQFWPAHYPPRAGA